MGTDLGQFLVSIELMSKYWHLSDHQIDQLKEAFLTAYQEHGPKISDEEISFYEDQVLKRYANMPEESLQGSEGHQARFIKDYSSFLIASSSSSSSSSVGSKS